MGEGIVVPEELVEVVTAAVALVATCDEAGAMSAEMVLAVERLRGALRAVLGWKVQRVPQRRGMERTRHA
jgi:hypothetical protein